VLQRVAACCSTLQRVAACELVIISSSVVHRCCVLQCVAVRGSGVAVCCNMLQWVAMCCNVLQCVAVRCSALQVCCTVLHCIAVGCCGLTCIAVCCSALQHATSSLYPPVSRTTSQPHTAASIRMSDTDKVRLSVLYCVAGCCSMVQYVANCCTLLQRVRGLAPRAQQSGKGLNSEIVIERKFKTEIKNSNEKFSKFVKIKS